MWQVMRRRSLCSDLSRSNFFFGYPLLCTEIAIGRTTQKNPVGAFKALGPNSPWWLVGALSVLTSFLFCLITQ